MKFLVDNALSPELARLLSEAGHDAVHLRDILPVNSSDQLVFEYAEKDARVILSADTDFGFLLANRLSSRPSFILLRHDAPATPTQQSALILNLISQTQSDLESGCILSVSKDKVRLRKLPIRR